MTKHAGTGEGQGRDLVACLHGLGRTRHCWWLLRRRLERAGYRTEAWTYPSIGKPIEVLAGDCRERLASLGADPGIRRIHLVTHSLGGIVARSALSQGLGGELAARLGAVIMLAPPNCGSPWARWLGPWLGWLAPSLPQLSDAPDSFVNRMASQKLEVRGEKRGESETLSLKEGAVPQFFVIAAEKDGKCPPATTHLAGQAGHLVVPGRHTLIMYRRDVARAILSTLEQFKTH